MAKRSKHTIRVDFTPTRVGNPSPNHHAERVRYLWMMVDQLQYPLRELLNSDRKRRRRRWLEEAQVRYKRLGRAIKHFNIEGE